MTNIEILDNLELDIDDFFKKKHINAYNIDSWTDKKSERTFNYTYEIKSNKKIDSGALYDYLFSESDILLHNLDMGIKIIPLENTDYYTRVNIIISVPNELVESKKSMKESINGDCYIYYDDDDNKRLVFCDYVKGITDTRDWFYLNEYIIDAIHIFKNEKQAQKFIDEHLKYFADQDKVVIAEYPQTVSGFFESKESATKSIKESADDNWYKLKMLNEMLDAMEEDEYNIPKLGIYGVTKNIDLDEGAIEALIKYYK